MATPTQIARKGHDLAFIEDGNKGQPTLAVKDHAIGAGKTRDSNTNSDLKWGVVGEPYTLVHNVAGGVLASASESVKHTFKRRRPEKRQFEINVPIVESVDSSEGVVAFNCPADRSFKIVSITENHQATEDSAAAANLQVEIVLDAAAPDLNNGLIANNTIDVETGGNAVEVVARATLNTRLANAVYGADELIVPPNSHILVNFVNDTSAAFVDTAEYIGCVTIILEEIEAEVYQEKVITINVSDQDNLLAAGVCVFTACTHRWKLKLVKESHAVVDGNAGAIELQVVKATGTQTTTTGTDVVASGGSGIGLKATANTVQTGTIITAGSADILEIGDRLLVCGGIAGSPTALGTYDGVFTLVVAPLLAPPTTANIVSIPLEKNMLVTGSDIFVADQDYRLVGVSMTPVIVDADNISGMLEKLSDGEAVGSGTLLVTAGALNLVGTVDTIQHVVPTAANAIITAGQRIAFYATDDDNSDAIILSTAFRGGITLFLEPINDARGTLESAFIYTNDTGGVMSVTSVSSIWERSETHATTLNVQVERLSGTEIIGAGDKIIGDTNIDVVNTAKNTRTAGTVVTSGFEDLASLDRLAVYFVNDAGTRVNPGDLDGLEVTVRMTAQAASAPPASEGVLFTNKTGRPVELRGAFAAWDVPESTSATLNLLLERLTVGEAGGAGNGDRLCGLTDINVKGADDTAASITPVTTIAIRAGTLTTGSGLDDITSGGSFTAPTGFLGRTVFTFTVDSTGGTDTFTTRRDGVILATKQDMATSAITIRGGDGITILWAAATGHTLDNVWTVVVSRNTILEDGDRLGYFFDVDAGGTVTVPTELEGLNITTQLVPTELAEASTT